MIEEYLRHIEALLSTSPAVRDVEIVRRSMRNTDLEKVLNYRYRVMIMRWSRVATVLWHASTAFHGAHRRHDDRATGRSRATLAAP